jgi:hypothetical protein
MPVAQQFSKSDLLSAWKQAKSRLDAMSTQERTQTLVQAGILTSKGNLRQPYKVLSSHASPKVGASERR